MPERGEKTRGGIRGLRDFEKLVCLREKMKVKWEIHQITRKKNKRKRIFQIIKFNMYQCVS